jgi:hypothetical protein
LLSLFVNLEHEGAVLKVCHSALDAESPEKRILIIRGLRVDPAMTKPEEETLDCHLKKKENAKQRRAHRADKRLPSFTAVGRGYDIARR